MHFLSSLTCFAAVVASTPLLERALPGTVQNASFDDVVITDPLLQYMPMPVYQGLSWQNMYAVLVGGGSQAIGKPIAGVQPHSGSKVAVFKPVPVSLFSLVPQGAVGTLTRTFPGSGVNSFDLKEFWFGCALSTAQSIVADVQACTLDVTGYKAATGNASPAPTTQSFVFYGDGFVTSKLAKAKLSGTAFDGLEKVVFTRRTVGLADLATEGVVLDDVAVVVR